MLVIILGLIVSFCIGFFIAAFFSQKVTCRSCISDEFILSKMNPGDLNEIILRNDKGLIINKKTYTKR
jgi:hypothetical protein